MLGKSHRYDKDAPIITIFTVLMQTLFIAIIVMQLCITEDLRALKLFLPFANIIVLVTSGLVVLSINQALVNARKSAQARILKSHLSTVDELINTLNAERHEYTRHVQTIQAMLYLDEVDKAKEYLDGVAKKYWHDDGLTYVGEPLLTGLISSKRAFAASMKIDFAFAFKCDPRKIPLEPWDLCSVIGNLVDNAFEAAIQEVAGARNVGIELKDEISGYSLYVYNTGPRIKDIEEIFLPGFTSNNSYGRGYGLYIVRRLVEGYGGYIEVNTTPRTTFIVHIPKEVNNVDSAFKYQYRKQSSNAIGV